VGELGTVVELRPERELTDDADETGGLVGSLFWRLQEGEVWVLCAESAFLFKDCWRRTILREAYMLARPCSHRQRRAEVLKTLARRWVTGEPLLLDLYTAERDGAELGISSDELGGNLYAAKLDRGPIISRKTVYFGSQKDVMLRVETPLARLRGRREDERIGEILKDTVYGPGWIFQKFVPLPGATEVEIVLQIDGDPYYRKLAEGETVRTDPRHAYAWDASVTYRRVRFGSVMDRLLRGSIPFQVEFQGPGRVWLSNLSFSEGYVGTVFTPSYWVFRIHAAVRRLLGHLNPASWL
jgi:hypothetical protein